MTDLQIIKNEANHRYEAVIGSSLAGYSEYNMMSDSIMFTHTEVFKEYEGQGVGAAIAQYVLDSARADGNYVIPVCQFMAGYIRKHRKYVDLVRPEVQKAFKI